MDKQVGKPKFDAMQVAQDFMGYFYNTWFTNPIGMYSLQHNGVELIKPYSKLLYEGVQYEGIQFVQFLENFAKSGVKFNVNKYDVYDSGSRMIQIHVLGTLVNNMELKTISQFFMLVYQGEKDNKWTLMNSTLLIS
jgi:hypothetical protein